jgi:uncharacterized protein YcgL (UPF0745 family)
LIQRKEVLVILINLGDKDLLAKIPLEKSKKALPERRFSLSQPSHGKKMLD